MKKGLKPLSTDYVPPLTRKISDPIAIKMQECYVIKHEDPSFEKAYQIMKKKQKKLNNSKISLENSNLRAMSREGSPYRRERSPLGRSALKSALMNSQSKQKENNLDLNLHSMTPGLKGSAQSKKETEP